MRYPLRHHSSLQVEQLEARELLAVDVTTITRSPTACYVDGIYNDILRREADPGGAAFYATRLDQGGAAFQQVALALASSAEYQSEFVQKLYHFYLGRAADPQGLTFWLDAAKAGATAEQLRAGFLASGEYLGKRGGTADGFLAGLYRDVLGRDPDAVGQAFFRGRLGEGAARADVALAVATSPEARLRLVNSFYQSFLHHSGSAAGVQFWVGRLQAGASEAEVIAGFAASDEYRALMMTPGSDVILDWEGALLDAVRVANTAPPPASRLMAMVGVAMYDAVQLVEQTHQIYNASGAITGLPGPALPGTSREAAAAAAAHTILVSAFPSQKATFDRRLAESLANVPDGVGETAGVELGTAVGNAILAWRANDGANAVVPYTPENQPGKWQPTPPAFAAAFAPQWGKVTPFALTSGSQFRPGGPPAVNSPAFAADFNEVKALGAANSTTRTADQTLIAQFWADGAGTETPPGHWIEIAQRVAIQQALPLGANARLFALLGMAEADAAIACWDAKYTYNLWRPVTAIRNTTPAVNPATVADPTWSPLLVTPPFPEYTSGHSTFSGAASAVLTAFFGSDVPILVGSDDVPGVVRSYDSFNQAADEAGRSRIYGGIHYQSANRDGLASGRSLGNFIVENFLK